MLLHNHQPTFPLPKSIRHFAGMILLPGHAVKNAAYKTPCNILPMVIL